MSSSIVQMDFQYFTVTLWHCCQHFRSLCPNSWRRSQRGVLLNSCGTGWFGWQLPAIRSYLHTQRLRRVSTCKHAMTSWDIILTCKLGIIYSFLGLFHGLFSEHWELPLLLSHLVAFGGLCCCEPCAWWLEVSQFLPRRDFAPSWHRNGVKLPRASSQSLWLHNSTFRFIWAEHYPMCLHYKLQRWRMLNFYKQTLFLLTNAWFF